MSTITYTAARENLAATMDQVCDDREPVVITRQKQRSVVMLSLDDYESLTETAYLLKSRANARRLLAATKQLEAGKGKSHKVNLDA
jgi:antitoxin YefM